MSNVLQLYLSQTRYLLLSLYSFFRLRQNAYNKLGLVLSLLPALGISCILGGCGGVQTSADTQVIAHSTKQGALTGAQPEMVVPKHLLLAEDMVQQGYYDVALRLLVLAKTKNDSAKRYYLLGTCYRENSRLNEAAAAFKQAVQMKEKYAEAYNGLGLTYLRLNATQKGIEAFKLAVKYDPMDLNYLNNLGYAFLKNEQYEESASLLQRCLIYDPDFSQAMYNLAICYVFNDKDKEALELLEKHNPTALAYEKLISLYQLKGDEQKAAEARQKLGQLQHPQSTIDFSYPKPLK